MRAPVAGSLLLAALLVVACGDATASPSPSPTPEPPTPTPSEDTSARCPDLAFDATASLDPMFDEESFANGESAVIGAAFVDGLSGIYQDEPGADPCGLFTGPGLEGAIALDPRLGPALAGTSTLDSDLVFRLAGEGGTYDLRKRPPTVPIDVIFDVPAGTTTTDLGSGATDTSLAAVRVFLRVTFAFDGSRWLADHVERMPAEASAPYALPQPVASLRRCRGFHDDPDGTAFDDQAGAGSNGLPRRRWCADGGHGGALPTDLVQLWTRFPCNETHVAVVTLGLPLGTPSDMLDRHYYFRDPAGEAVARGWLQDSWTRSATLPDEAEDTGWTNGNMDVWIDPSEVESAIYVRTGGRYERWPRGGDPSVTDCN